MTNWTVSPASAPLRGELRVPSDKSISHRAVLLAGLARGSSTIRRPLLGEDVRCTMAAVQALGATIEEKEDELTIEGAPVLQSPSAPIDCGNSGTLIRLLAGAICGRGVACELIGDESLSGRPMRRIVEPLERMGASIAAADNGTPPLQIRPVAGLQSIAYEMPMASAQVKSAVLLAGLTADGGAAAIEPAPCRDHTERILPAFGASVHVDGRRIEVEQCSELQAAQIDVPADPSSAAFFMVAASIVEGSDLLLREVGVNPTRSGIINLLQRMGADIELGNERQTGSEPVADIRVRSAKLTGISIGAADVPAAIDEFPALLAAAAAASGTTAVSGAAELRAKESDRIAAMAAALAALGIECSEQPDGIVVQGGQLRAGSVDSRGDHRIAMAMAAAASVANGPVQIANCANVATSFPGFAGMASSIGMGVR